MQVSIAKREAKVAQSLILKDELKSRQRVLRRLNYVDAEGVVTVKGKVGHEGVSGEREKRAGQLVFEAKGEYLGCSGQTGEMQSAVLFVGAIRLC